MIKNLTNNDLINEAINELILIKTDNCIFFGEFALRLNYYEVDEKSHIDTCAVNVNHDGFNLYYNSSFVNTLNVEQVKFVLIHEIFHLIWNHTKRTSIGKFDNKIANIAQDMIINSTIVNKYLRSDSEFKPRLEIPTNDDDENIGVFLPNEFLDEHNEDKEYFEFVYDWIKERKKKKKDLPTSPVKGSEVGENASASKSDESKDASNEDGEVGADSSDYGPNSRDNNDKPIDCKSLNSILKSSDYKGFDNHIPNEISDDMKENMIAETIKEIENNLSNRGEKTNNHKDIIDKLIRKRKDYLRDIRRGLGFQFSSTGIKTKTITKPHRRDIWGVKGKRKMKPKLNIILDTSNSMKNVFEKTLSYIFRNDININLIQCDTTVKEVKNITNMNKLNKLQIHGLGGTKLQPGIDYITNDKKLNRYNLVILTDGYTDTLNLSKIKGKVMIISTTKKCKISKESSKGVKQIITE